MCRPPILLIFVELSVLTATSSSQATAINPSEIPTVTIYGANTTTSSASPTLTNQGTQYNTVSHEQIQKQAANDINHALSQVPGVMTRSETLLGGQSSHNLYIRGRGASHPSSDISITFDDVPRMGALYGQSLFEGIGMNSIDSIDVFKSPQPDRFGSGYASININPRKMATEGILGQTSLAGGSYKTLQEEVSVGHKAGDFDVFASQLWLSTDGHREHSRAQQESYFLNTGLRLGPHHEVRWIVNHSKGQTLQPDSTITGKRNYERFDIDTDFTTFTLNNTYENAQGYVKAYYNNTTYKLLGEESNTKASTQTIKLYGVRAKEIWQTKNGPQVTLGMDFDCADLANRQQTYGTGATTYWDFPKTVLLSPYLAINKDFVWNECILTPSIGLRYFQHNEFQDKLSTQAGLVVRYNRLHIHANYARSVNYPSPVVLQNAVKRDSQTFQSWSNIRPEVADHIEIGIGHFLGESGQCNLTIFQDKGKDRFRAYMFGPSPVQWNDPIGRYKINGIEASMSGHLARHLSGHCAITHLNVSATDNKGVESVHMPYTPKWMVQSGLTWNIDSNWELDGNLLHMNNLWEGTSARAKGFQYQASKKLDNVTLVNLKLSRKISGVAKGEAYLAVHNLLDSTYCLESGYPMPGITVLFGCQLQLP